MDGVPSRENQNQNRKSNLSEPNKIFVAPVFRVQKLTAGVRFKDCSINTMFAQALRHSITHYYCNHGLQAVPEEIHSWTYGCIS